MDINRFTADRTAATVAFIARLHADPTNRIGYLGDDEPGIRHELDDLTVPPVVGFRLAEAGGRLVGVMGYDADETLGRAWLYGPWVDDPNWHDVAAALYDTVIAGLPAAVTQLELFGHVDNRNLEQLARRRGFRALPEVYLLGLERTLLRPQANGVVDLPDELQGPFAQLHAAVFPNTYYTADQLLALRDDDHRLLAAVVDGSLRGYVFLQRQPPDGAYLDFLAVDEAARGSGLGRLLLDGAVSAAFAWPETNRLTLTVNGDNPVALALYRSAGFEALQALRGYRRTRT